jgi:hypothetical protein
MYDMCDICEMYEPRGLRSSRGCRALTRDPCYARHLGSAEDNRPARMESG